MSKNTKIIAVVGGVLICLGLAYMIFSGGSTMEAIGCGKKKNKAQRVKKFSAKQMVWQSCQKYGYVAELDKKTNKVVTVKKDANCKDGGKKKCKKSAKPAGGDMKAAKCACNLLKVKPCAKEEFKKNNKAFCKSLANNIKKFKCEEGGEGGDDDGE